MEGGFLDMMGNILGNNISNEIYFVYGLIAVVLILIVVILVMDHQAKSRLHKNLFNNKVLRKNLKHLEETGELPVVAPKKKEEKPFIPITKVEPIVLKSSKKQNQTLDPVDFATSFQESVQPVKKESVVSAPSTPKVSVSMSSSETEKCEPAVTVPKQTTNRPVLEEFKMPKPVPKIKPVEVAPEKPLPSPKKTEIPDVEILDFATEEPRSLYQTRITMPEIPVLAPEPATPSRPKPYEGKIPSYFDEIPRIIQDTKAPKISVEPEPVEVLKVAPKVSDKKREELKELARQSQIDYIEEDDALEKTQAQLEIEKITSLLEDNEESDTLIEQTMFEKEQEASAIISMDELMKRSDELYNANERMQYLAEEDSPITIEELKRKVEKEHAASIRVDLNQEDVKKERDDTRRYRATSIMASIYAPDGTTDDIETI